MKTTLFGMPDFRNLGPYLHKPATTRADDVLAAIRRAA